MLNLFTQKKQLLGLLLVSAVLIVVALPSRAAASNYGQVCRGVAFTGDTCDGPNDARAQNSLDNLIQSGLEIFSIIIGIVGVAMVMFGGFKYITAGGDSSKINSAQQLITYALVGLVIAALAQVIARFVLSQAT